MKSIFNIFFISNWIKWSTNMTSTEKEELEKRLEELNNEIKPVLDRLREIELKENIENCKDYIGKCYALPNSYGRPRDERWTYYLKAIGINEDDGLLNVLTCQVFPTGDIEIKTSQRGLYHFEGRGSDADFIKKCEITPDEFERHFKEILAKTGVSQLPTTKVVGL